MAWKFSGLDDLISWFLNTPWGAKVVTDALAGVGGEHLRQVVYEYAERHLLTMGREKVVVEMHADGFVRVFGSKRVDAVLINRPEPLLGEPPDLSTPIDTLMELDLPEAYRDVYCPRDCRATGVHKPTTIRQYARAYHETQFDLLALQVLDEIAQANRPVPHADPGGERSPADGRPAGDRGADAL